MGRIILAFFQTVFCYTAYNYFNYTHFIFLVILAASLPLLLTIINNKKYLQFFWIFFFSTTLILIIFWNLNIYEIINNNWIIYTLKNIYTELNSADLFNIKKNPIWKLFD